MPGRRSAISAQGLSCRPWADYRGCVWTYDFVYDRTESNRVLKMLAVLDEYTRECHWIKVEYGLDSEAVIETLSVLLEVHGAPRHLRSDNGGELIAEIVKQCLGLAGIGTGASTRKCSTTGDTRRR